MAQRPSTPVKVPSSAANHTTATLDPDLRSQVNTVLLRDGHVTKIQEVLLHALNANTTNWPTAIQNHALALLRSGEITTFPALINQVLDDVREQTAASNASSSSASGANGKAATNGDSKKVNGAAGAEKLSLAVPTSVVEEAMKITRECLDAVCEIEPSGSS